MILSIFASWETKDVIEVTLALITIGTVLFGFGTKTGRMETMIKDLSRDVDQLRKSLEQHRVNTDSRFEAERSRQESALEKLRSDFAIQFDKLGNRIESMQSVLLRETTSMREVVSILITILKKNGSND